MAADANRFEALFEVMKTGGAKELHSACEELVRLWRDIPVEPLLHLKEQFHRLDMEHREAHLDEALVSVAEKRPGPFTAIATEPGHPLWRQAADVLSMVGDPAYLDLFVSLIPLVPKRDLRGLVRAIERFRGPKVVNALGPFVSADDEEIFLDALMVLKREGTPEALAFLAEGYEAKRREGSPDAPVIKAVIQELERGGEVKTA